MTEPAADDLDLASTLPASREEMLEAIPLHVVVWDGDDHPVDLDAADPAVDTDGRRRCITARKAGGRCTATAPADSLLCNAHSGRLDPSAGGNARAANVREARERDEDRAAARRLGVRGAIQGVLTRRIRQVEQTLEVLLDAGSEGDLAAAKALIPYLNQALGMPTERVEMERPGTAADLENAPTEQLLDMVAARRKRRADQASAESS